VVAVATLTLAAPKQALRAPGVASAVGALYLPASVAFSTFHCHELACVRLASERLSGR
jgi:hypothetical protein